MILKSILAISIHALTRSATYCYVWTSVSRVYFNPRTHEECDLGLFSRSTRFKIFQSTHSRGVRRRSRAPEDKKKVFQSTHSRGVRRQGSGKTMSLVAISIHALTRSATIVYALSLVKNIISIHALTRSATLPAVGATSIFSISIHALTRSATAIA